jgi:hypothetical protein
MKQIFKNLRCFALIMFSASLLVTACSGGGGGNGNNPVSSDSKTLVSFSIISPVTAAGLINETAKTVDVTVPHDTDVKALVAKFSTTGAATLVGTNEQKSEVTANNFTNPVTYTVKATDGSTQNYIVTVTVATNSAKEITAFSINGVEGTITGTNIALTLPAGTDKTSLVAAFSITGMSLKVGITEQVNNSTANNFSSAVTYTVTAGDGSTQNYIVTVSVELYTGTSFTAFSINGRATISGTNISLALPYGTNAKDLVAAFTVSPGASVKIGSTVQTSCITHNNFTSPVTYTVTAENGSTQNYTVTVTVSSFTGQAWSSVDGGGTNGINDYTATTNTTSPYCTSYNGELYAIWQESSLIQIHIKKYNGSAWVSVGNTSGQSKLNASTYGAANPKVIAYNGYLYAAWHECDTANDPNLPGVHVKRYNGTAWTFDQDYTTGQNRRDINKGETAQARNVDLVVCNGELYAAWSEDANITGIAQLRASKFNGSLWTSIDGDGQFGLNYDTANNISIMNPPVLCVYNNHVYVAWVEAIGTGSQLFVKRYDGGSTWTWVGGSGGIGLNYNSAQQVYVPSLTSDNDRMYLFWREYATANRVRVKQFDGSSWTTDPDGGSGWRHNANTSYSPFGYRFGNLNFITWAENLSAVWQIRVVSFDGTSKTYLDGDGNYGVNQNTTMDADLPKLTENKGDLYSVWLEDTSGTNNTNQIRAKKYPLPPIVTSVSVPASATYTAGQSLNFTVNFSKNVVVSGGTPYLPVILNSGTVYAVYTGGSGTSSLAFRFTVGSGNTDSNGIEIGAAIAGAVLESQDTSPLPANYTLFNAGSTTGVILAP